MASQRKRVFSNDNPSGSYRSTRSNSPPSLVEYSSQFQESSNSLDDMQMEGSQRLQFTDDSVMNRQPISLYREKQSCASPRPTQSPSHQPRLRGTHSPFPRKSPHRNLSGDFDASNNTPTTPYGMLNPGPMNKDKPFFKTWQSALPLRGVTGNRQWIALFGFCTLALLGIAVYQHDAMLQEALHLRELEVDHHIVHAKELEKRLQAMRVHSLDLQDRLDRSEGEPKIDLETQRKLFVLEHTQLKMQHDIQSMCIRLVREKYGNGPRYYVQMKLEFDPQSNVYNDHRAGDEIMIETASIHDMPHSVYLFLEQVSHHLYDHTTFHRNSAHLVQAGPNENVQAHARFRHYPSLNSVIFQEYAPEITHKQYTLGYPGRPGGPDFYVNMRDNSAINGPGGQHTHYSDVIMDADPCFAKIVKGWNAIERVHRSAVDGDAIVHPVLIANMKVMPADYLPIHSDSSDSEDYQIEQRPAVMMD